MADEHAVWLVPDPASRTGHSVRVIGWSMTVEEMLVVILVDAKADPDEAPHSEWWGAIAWVAGIRERRLYGEEER